MSPLFNKAPRRDVPENMSHDRAVVEKRVEKCLSLSLRRFWEDAVSNQLYDPIYDDPYHNETLLNVSVGKQRLLQSSRRHRRPSKALFEGGSDNRRRGCRGPCCKRRPGRVLLDCACIRGPERPVLPWRCCTCPPGRLPSDGTAQNSAVPQHGRIPGGILFGSTLRSQRARDGGATCRSSVVHGHATGRGSPLLSLRCHKPLQS